MKIRHLQKLAAVLLLGALAIVSSCKKNLTPKGAVTTATVYKNFNNYTSILAKLYTAFAISGQNGGAGNPDIAGIDEGFSNYLRELINMEDLTTDEGSIVWNDGTIHTLHDMTWNSQCEFIGAMYDRIYYEISLDNEFLRNTTPAMLSKNGITSSDQVATVTRFRAEARFLRALAYYHAIDLFGNVPIVTENDQVGVFFPVQKSRAEVFSYIETELKAIQGDLGAPRFSYGHADQAADWTLLAKLYLNAKVFTGTDRSTDAITYANKVIAAGYTLEPHFKNLFLADNNKSNEIIFPIESDGIHTQGYGGMTYLVHAQVGGSMNPANFGINGGWSGFRTTEQYVSLFSDPSGNTDTRAMFYTNGQTLGMADEYTFTDGYAIAKFKNVTSTGVAGSDPTGNFVDTDFPLFRLADVYLIYAEAVLRGGSGGDMATALKYVNMVRTRAYDGSTSGNITAGQLTLPFILAERGRELLFEAQRRTDLIRFGEFTGSDYLWQWKGGVLNGTSVSDYRNLMPIPSAQIVTNPTLKQNPGYN